MQRLINANSVLEQAWQNFYKQENEHEKLYEDYDILRDRHFEQCGFECCQQTIVNAPTVLTLPEQPTNGQIIMAMFPDVSVTEIGGGSTIVVAHDLKFNVTWWNSPYKRGNET